MHGVNTYPTLREAVKRRKGPKRIYAFNVPCTYIVAREKTFFEKVLNPTPSESRYFFEVIEEDKPCHLYVDLDVNKEKFPGIDVHEVKSMVCGHIEFGLKQMDLEIDKKIVAESSSDKKGSLHILYKIKGKIFASNAHVGAFMRACLQKRVVNFPEDQHTWSLFVDMCVYSRNRLFRMLGCTKKHEKRTKRVQGQVFNYENWLDSMVQPLSTKDEIMETYEPDGSPARYMGNKALSLSADYNPDIKEKLVEFASQVAPVRGISYIPAFRVWIINLQKKDCIFKKEKHGKNTNYMVINEGDHIRPDHSYHFRCWSQKYECCKGAKTDKVPLPDDLARLMKAQNEFMIYPSVSSTSTISSNSR